ncbi:hypothetical protein TWF694_004448 [Orbilia ellipsospora]|uniref:Uncharacterized protein n=1 Tax=Orbilia ellipsospora TaxID=2528407 RepID=A0AAV9X1A7_9PEZI
MSKVNGYACNVGGYVQTTVTLDKVDASSPADVGFSCSLKSNSTAISICQLFTRGATWTGGLKSEFAATEDGLHSGRAYLVLVNPGTATAQKYLNERKEWAKVGQVKAYPEVGISDTVLGTLCYGAMDAVEREVEISSLKPNQDPQFAAYVPPKKEGNYAGGDDPTIYKFDDIINRLVAGNETSEERGILKLDPPSDGWARDISNQTGSNGPWYIDGTKLMRGVTFLMDALRLDDNELAYAGGLNTIG